ncbi:MAG: sigma-70 family RNA polymerase sigma factor [Rufibacter sp.]
MTAPFISSAVFPCTQEAFSLAYHLLGEIEEAQDIVQDATQKWLQLDTTQVQNPKAYALRMVTNLCLNRLPALQTQRRSYEGPWLPEPYLPDSGHVAFEREHSIGLALHLLLDKLNPYERTVLLLADIFEYSHREIAQIIEKSEANTRQIFKRAKEKVQNRTLTAKTPPSQQEALVQAFLSAARQGDLEQLIQLFQAEIKVYSDSGGKVSMARNVLVGADAAAKLLAGIFRKKGDGLEVELAPLNAGEIGLIGRRPDSIFGTMQFEVQDGKISQVFITGNPEKLTFIS